MKNTCKNTCKNPPLGGSEIFNSFQGLETGWLARQFLGNRLATSEGAVSNTQLLTVPYPPKSWNPGWASCCASLTVPVVRACAPPHDVTIPYRTAVPEDNLAAAGGGEAKKWAVSND